jgi:hypothetical protein
MIGVVGLLFIAADATQTTDLAPRKTQPGPYGRLPFMFEANHGQADSQVQFFARGAGYQLFLSHGEAVLAFMPPAAESRASGRVPAKPRNAQPVRDTKQAVVRMTLQGAKPDPHAVGVEQLAGKVNYLRGNDPDKWRTNVPTYGKVRYEAVYPGIDLVYYGHERQLEYDFIVAPGADVNVIRLRFEGATHVAIDIRGDLVLSTAVGDVRFEKPLVYQNIDGVRRAIEGGYVSNGPGSHTIGFQVGPYDPYRPLIIDPILRYSTYVGGSGFDVATGIAVDATGAAYIAGTTESPDFPISSALEPMLLGFDAFVAKFTADGALVYSTFLGGSLGDEGRDIAVDANGGVYILGATNSSDFPTLNATQPTWGGGIIMGQPGCPCPAPDAFVSKLAPDGSRLIYSTFLGGSDADQPNEIAVDDAGSAYVTGGTYSLNFPVARALQPTRAGFSDGFVAKFTRDGTSLVYSTYLGGTLDDGVTGIAVDTVGSAYVAGGTASPDFPLVNALQPSVSGAFVAKFTPDGRTLAYSTFLGGSGNDGAQDIAVDSDGHAYVTGFTDSPDFPIVHAEDPLLGGFEDAFVAKLSGDGRELVYSTYLGGSDNEFGSGIAVDTTGAAYVTGWTASPDFPVVNPAQPALVGDADVFLVKLPPDGAGFVYSTHLGGSMDDSAEAIAVDRAGAAYIVGGTHSTDFPTVNAIQPELGEPVGHDAFVAKVISSRIMNEFLTFVPIESTFATSSDISGCPSDSLGQFTLSATLSNASVGSPLSNLVLNVTTLTNGNVLKNADGGPGGVANTLTVAREGVYSDGTLSPGESVDVPFHVCLKTLEPFRFFVDVHSVD